MSSLARRTRSGFSAFFTVSAMACLAFAASAHAQQSAVETSRAQSTSQPQYTIRAHVPLTIVDVTVTDAKGKPVHGLKQSDFTLLEDGHEMKPASFDEHRTDEAAPTQVEQKLPPNTFTNVTPSTPQATPIVILLIDNLNTPTQAQQQVTQRLLDFARKMPQGTPMAVLLLTTHLSILQGFTTDPKLIEAAFNNKKATTQQSPIADPSDAGAGESTEAQGDQTSLRGEYILAALRQIARMASGMPGRKNLVWFTGAFPTKFPPVRDPYAFPMNFCLGDNCAPEPTIYDFEAELKSATDLLAHSHIAVYPIDSRGIQYPDAPVMSKSSTTMMTNRMNLRFAEHDTMDTVAEATGGKAVYNSNDFAGAVLDAIDSGSNYYTFTYRPVNQTLDTRFRTIMVNVDRPGLNLTYRNGYYAVAPDVDSAGKKIEKVSAMQAAMMRGALDATQILFKVKAVQAVATEISLPLHNVPDPKQMKPPYRHYSISYTIDIHNMQFTTAPDGNYHASFEYGIRVYNADGDEIVNSASKEAHLVLTPAVYQSMLKNGAVSRDEIDVPAKGDYFLRIAVHDLASDRVGAIEVPTASIAPEVVPAVTAPK
jgi:VWFA-related protein